MAAVPALPQAALASIDGPPQQLSREEVLQVIKVLETMKHQGVPTSDRKYATMVKLLRAQNLAALGFIKDRPAAALSQAAPPVAQSPAASTSAPSEPAVPTDPALVQMNEELQQSKFSAPAVKNTAFSPAQMHQLKAQVLAFRYLTHNMPLPTNLMMAIRGAAPSTGNFSKLPISNRVPVPVQGAGMPQVPYGTPAPYAPGPQMGRPYAQPLPTQYAQAPGPVGPVKLDPRFLYQERERRVLAKMAYRVNELLQVIPTLTGTVRMRAEIELKQLKLISLQRSARRQIADELRRAIQLEATLEASAFKRQRKERRGYATDRIENKRQVDVEMRRRAKQREFLNAVITHARDFKNFHMENQTKMKKVVKQIVAQRARLEKREQERRERAEKDRLRALKANDEEGYRKLLEETKNERLKLLLKQTDEYLDKLGAMVQLEKERNEEEERAEREAKEKEKEKGAAAGTTSAANSGSTAAAAVGAANADPKAPARQDLLSKAKARETYYKIAHTVHEEIAQQPDCLVGGQLKEYQMHGLQWLVSLYNNSLNGILADEMGLGKTIQTISLVCYLMEKKKINGPYLIVVPLSTLTNWTMEFEKWAPSVVKVVFKGKPAVRKTLYDNRIAHGRFNVVLTTYEYIMKDKNMLAKIKWNYIIIDEGHRMKNHGCKLSAIFSQYYSSRHRLLLTGTPLQNSLPELWSLLNFLLPTIFNSVQNFEQWFSAPFAAAGEKMEMNEEESLLIINRLHQVLRPFLLRRLKREVESQLPDKVEKVLKCEMSAMQKKMYQHMHKSGVMVFDPAAEKNGTKPGVKGLMNTLMQLRKICNHPYLFETEGGHEPEHLIRCSGKFVLLDRILPKLRAAGHRVLIFSQMTQLMTVMEDYFVYRGFKYLRLDGGTKAEDRGELLERFNAVDSPYFIFMLSTRAGGLGLNLQSADTVILFDSDWNPQIDLQAQDRAHRIGQTAEVRVFRLMTINSIEERILARAQFKMAMDAKVIQAGKFNNVSTQEERRAMLETLLSKDYSEENNEDEFTTLAHEEQDAVINSMISRNEDELRMYEEYDAERSVQDGEAWKAAGKTGPPPNRLVQEAELPDWLKHGEMQIEQRGGMVAYGRGKREHGTINYNDTEIDRLIEGSSDEEGSSAAGRASAAAVAGSASVPSVGAKLGSKRMSEAPVADAKRGRKPGPRAKAPTSEALQAHVLYRQVWEEMKNVKDEPTGRQLMKIFMRLPARTQLPDYYMLIAQPMDMARIMKKLEKTKYSSPQELNSDFLLIFKNALQYNAEGSDIVNDARRLQAIWEKKYQQLLVDLAKPPSERVVSVPVKMKDETSASSSVSAAASASASGGGGGTTFKLALKRRNPVTPDKPAEVVQQLQPKRSKNDEDEDEDESEGISV